MKMRIWIICLIGLGAIRVYAQPQPLDSLLRLEKSYLRADSVRAKLLTDIARAYYAIAPDKGLQFADKAIALAETLPDKKHLAAAYSAKGNNKMALSEYPAALEYYQKALAINERAGNRQGIANNLNNIGLVYYSIFEYPRSLEYYQKALTINEQTGNRTGIANGLGNIGNIYNELRDFPKAIEYYQQALTINESAGNLQNLSGILVNIGNVYTQLADFPKALEYKQRALAISEKLGNKQMITNNLSNIGNVYTQLADYPQALKYHQRALAINESIQHKKGMAANLSGISTVYLFQKNYPAATEFAQKARSLARNHGLLITECEALLNLNKIYEATERFDSAYVAYRQYILLRDSMTNVEVKKQVTKKTLQFEFSKTEDSLKQQQLLTDARLTQQILLATKQQQQLAFAENEKQLQATQVNLQQAQLQLKDRELQAQRRQQIYYIGSIALLALLSFFVFRNYKNQQKSNRIIRLEKQKSDDLLRNILPDEVADELKNKGEALARQYNTVTVLFTDFVDFTKASENRSPQQLVSELHTCFKAFDEIMEQYGMEKIKTIGDAYMAVSGLPTPDAQHARKAARAALDIRQYVQQRQRQQPESFEIRIGLSSGPVVAGIVGVKKFAYDIWGDTVNTAARMESGSEPGKINISGATYALIKTEFQCVHRGKVTAKNKGEIDMYFLEGEGQQIVSKS